MCYVGLFNCLTSDHYIIFGIFSLVGLERDQLGLSCLKCCSAHSFVVWLAFDEIR